MTWTHAPWLILGWLAEPTGDPEGHTLQQEWIFQPLLSVPAWGLLCTVAFLLAAAAYCSRKVHISASGRVALLLLRASVLLLVAALLLQPTLRREMQRDLPRPLAVVADHTSSMATRDNGERAASRWQQAIEALQPFTSGQDGQIRLFCFDRQITPMTWADLSALPSPNPELPVHLEVAMKELCGTLAAGPEAHVVLVTDGVAGAAADEADLLAQARRLRQAGITLHVAVAGREDLPVLSLRPLEASTCAFVREPIRLPVHLELDGPTDASVRIALMQSDNCLGTRELVLPAASERIESFEIRFDQPGIRHCQFRVESDAGPIVLRGTTNVDIQVTDQPIRVLYVDRQPRWSFRLLGNAFARDPRISPRFVLLEQKETAGSLSRLPVEASEWSEFDAVILGDIRPTDLSDAQWQGLYDHVVEAGAGLILAAGPGHMPADFMKSPLADLLPFGRVMPDAHPSEQSWPLRPTRLGDEHPILKLQSQEQTAALWSALPGMYWYSLIGSLKPGAQVLAEKPDTADSRRCPVVILQPVGRGQVLFIGTDETWRWRREVGDRYFYRFWAQAAMFVGLGHRTQSPSATAIASAGDASPADEPIDLRARGELLRRLAHEGGGQCVALTDLPGLLQRLADEEFPERWAQSVTVWDRWPTLAVFVVLIGAEWLLRRRFHLP
jgi:hypothetical protein